LKCDGQSPDLLTQWTIEEGPSQCYLDVALFTDVGRRLYSIIFSPIVKMDGIGTWVRRQFTAI